MDTENKVLNGYGVLYALMLSKSTGVPVGKVIELLNKAGEEVPSMDIDLSVV